MTVQRIKDLLTSIDPEVQRYDHDRAGQADAYTVWREIGPVGHYGEGQEMGTIHFQVDRFTKEEDEETALAILQMLESQDDIGVDYLVDYERDTGYIHHIYDCGGV